MSDDRCGATLVYLSPGSEYACILDRGHEGAHQDMDGDLWTIRFPDEKPQFSPGYIHGALDGLRGRIERLEDWREQSARPVQEQGDREDVISVLKDIRRMMRFLLRTSV